MSICVHNTAAPAAAYAGTGTVRERVLVLTHAPRPPIEFANGTGFRFLAATSADALAEATGAAGGLESGYQVTVEAAPSGTTHLTFRR